MKKRFRMVGAPVVAGAQFAIIDEPSPVIKRIACSYPAMLKIRSIPTTQGDLQELQMSAYLRTPGTFHLRGRIRTHFRRQ